MQHSGKGEVSQVASPARHLLEGVEATGSRADDRFWRYLTCDLSQRPLCVNPTTDKLNCMLAVAFRAVKKSSGLCRHKHRPGALVAFLTAMNPAGVTCGR
jgi:hypothetical protein